MTRRTSKRLRTSARRLALELLEARLCLATAPAFSSLPGADHTILLDFDGHTTEGTTWNASYGVSSIVSPPYDIDGNPSSFNATELQRIEAAWKWVAEDFAPFDINVTTVDPGAAALSYTGGGDTQWGVRVVITDDTFANCGCGGHAYVGSFDDSQDEPVFVYNTSLKGVSEASTHEAGHALGLRHDGTSTDAYYWGHGSGATSWAPLMGASYNRNVTQWSKGEYFDASRTEDDLAILSSLTNGNGFGFRADDHGNTDGAATSLPGTAISGAGIIETPADVDVFTFATGAGNVTLDIDPAATGPNLDVKATLYDGSGSLVATSDDGSVLDAGFNLTLAAGQYYLHVEGTGTGSPFSSTPSGYTEYGSLGQYSLSGTIVDPGGLPSLTIDDVSVGEADGTATFTVTLAGNVTDPVSVDFATASGTADVGDDFGAVSGTLSFVAAGTQAITVNIVDDNLAEGTENFSVSLSNATNALVADGQGTGTIQDNDTELSVNDVAASEGNLAKGKKNGGAPQLRDFVFTVSLSTAVGHSVTVDYATMDVGSAVAGQDYESTAGSLTFAPGQLSQSVTVTVRGDNDPEPDETFKVVLSTPSGASLADSEGVGTIQDDDTKGGGGGGGNGRGNNRNTREIEAFDPVWWFEGPGEEHDQHHDHHHEHHGHDHHGHDHPPFPLDLQAGSNALASPLSARLAPSHVAELWGRYDPIGGLLELDPHGASADEDPLAPLASRPGDWDTGDRETGRWTDRVFDADRDDAEQDQELLDLLQ